MMTMYPIIRCKRLSPGVELPSYAHDGDAGMDLCATEDVTLLPGQWKMVGSGVSMAIPKGFVGLVVPRSGLGCKGLVLKNTIGVIDSPYRGEIKVPLLNNNPIGLWKRIKNLVCYRLLEMTDEPEDTIHVHKGDRVAQLLIIPVAHSTLVDADALDETERGQGGFGSTGITGGEWL